MRDARTYILAPFLLLAACSDPQGPCDVGDACRFEGPHLVASVELDGEHADAGGLPGVMPGPVTLLVDISNQGDTLTPPARVRFGISGSEFAEAVLGFDLPALRPGDVVRGPVVVTVDAEMLTGTDVRVAWLRIELPDDPAVELASAESGEFRVLLPVAELALTDVPDTVAFGGQANVSLRVGNRSLYAPLDARTVRLRLRNTTYADTFPEWQVLTLPAVAAGAEYEQEFTVFVPGNAGFWMDGYNPLYGTEAQETFDRYQTYRLGACLGSNDLLCVLSPGTVRGQLDLEPCTGGTAIEGHTVTVGLLCTDTYAGPVAVWRLEAETGTAYALSISNPGGPGVTRILKRDGTLVASYVGNNAAPHFAEAGVYYVVFWSEQYPLLHPLTLTTEPAPPPPGATP